MPNIRLTEQQFMEAISEGIRLGFMDMLRSGTECRLPTFTPAVQDGIDAASGHATTPPRAAIRLITSRFQRFFLHSFSGSRRAWR